MDSTKTPNTNKKNNSESSDMKVFRWILGEDLVAQTISTGFDMVKMMAYYRCAMMEVKTKFDVLNEEFSLINNLNPICSIKTRLKDPVSIIDKIKRKGIPSTVPAIEHSISDIAGVRVVCSFIDDVYMLANALMKQDDVVTLIKKDYIENPKPNGYRSLHLIVSVPIFLAHEKRKMKVEIQLRTMAMDCWATLEHKLKYKKSVKFTDSMAEELRQCAVISAETDAHMNNLRKKVLEQYLDNN